MQPGAGTLKFIDETAGVIAGYSQEDGHEVDSDASREEDQPSDSGRLSVIQTSECSPSEVFSSNTRRTSTCEHLFHGRISSRATNGRKYIDGEQQLWRDMGGDAVDSYSTTLSTPLNAPYLQHYSPTVPPIPNARTPFDHRSVPELSHSGSAPTYNILHHLSLHDLTSDDPFWSGLVKQPAASDIHRGQNRLQAILLRYFTEEIAYRFDLCDPERHFAQVVPQRARSCPPLLNAILTTSARHLTRLQRYRNTAGVVEWQGNILPDLKEELAVYYHNECIKDLLRLSMDPEQTHNENLLAAAIILRTDEEMDAAVREEEGDKEVFLRMLNIFINAQVPTVVAPPHLSPQVYISQPGIHTGSGIPCFAASPNSQSLSVSSPIQATSPNPQTPRTPRADGLRQAAVWVALRQELFTSYMKHRPLNFPLSYCDALRSFSAAEDAVWADSLIIFCADVLEHCYGNSDAGSPHNTDEMRWHELKHYEHELCLALPDSFAPTYYRAPNVGSGECFPEIWHLDDCHVTGTTHVELARILLAVYNPTRPRLGQGYAASMRELTSELKRIVLRLCGIALSNRRLPSVFNEALMGIATCGEYFEERTEQGALLDVLDIMKNDHAYPTAKVVVTLKEAWGWT